MSEEWPLHVRVADALGCKLEISLLSRGFRKEDDRYRYLCLCADHAHAGFGPAGPEVLPYDTAWSATGPLIEKCGITLEWSECQRHEGCVPCWSARARNELPEGVGGTHLSAVCELLIKLGAAGRL